MVFKKVLKIVSIVILSFIGFCFLVLLIGLGSCLLSGSLSYDLYYNDDYAIGYSDYCKDAFMGPVTLHEGYETNIVLPDEYNGYHITKLGGYYGRGVPTPYYVTYNDESVNSGSLYEYYIQDPSKFGTVIEINVNITLPKYLEEIEVKDCDKYITCVESEDYTETYTTYIVRGYYTIDESNEYFYTLDGKVYNKKTNELIDAFIYCE